MPILFHTLPHYLQRWTRKRQTPSWLNDSIIIEDDRVTVLNKGQVLNFDFSITGMFHLQKVSIYINALDFTENKKGAIGNFNGVDINNKIVHGNLLIETIR